MENTLRINYRHDFERGSFTQEYRIFTVNFKDFSSKGGRSRTPPGTLHPTTPMMSIQNHLHFVNHSVPDKNRTPRLLFNEKKIRCEEHWMRWTNPSKLVANWPTICNKIIEMAILLNRNVFMTSSMWWSPNSTEHSREFGFTVGTRLRRMQKTYLYMHTSTRWNLKTRKISENTIKCNAVDKRRLPWWPCLNFRCRAIYRTVNRRSFFPA
jgi:hypothetical protein